MDLRQIRYFLAVCEIRNFTRAADRCHVTQPSLTRAIQNLEQELGGPLFVRARGGATLTPLGEVMRQEFSQVQSHANSARATARGWAKGTRGMLRIGVSTGAGPKGVGCFLGAFQTCHEDVALTVVQGTVDDLLDSLDASDIDAAMITCPRGLPPMPRCRCLYDERFVVLIPLHHRLAALDLVSLNDLANERVLLSDHSDFRDTFVIPLKAARVEVRITCHSARDEWLTGMVEAGAGIAIVPEGFPPPPLLTTRPLSDPTRLQSVHLLCGKDSAANPVLRKMSDFAEEYIAARPGMPAEEIAGH